MVRTPVIWWGEGGNSAAADIWTHQELRQLSPGYTLKYSWVPSESFNHFWFTWAEYLKEPQARWCTLLQYRETVGPYGCECARKLLTECPEDTPDDRCGLPFYLSLSPLVLTPTKLPHCWYCSGNTQIVTNVSSDILTQLWDFWSRPTNLWWQQWDLLLAVIHKKLSMPIDKRWDLWSPHCGFVLTTVHTSSGGDIGRHQPVTITITTQSPPISQQMCQLNFLPSHPLFSYMSCTAISRMKTSCTVKLITDMSQNINLIHCNALNTLQCIGYIEYIAMHWSGK